MSEKFSIFLKLVIAHCIIISCGADFVNNYQPDPRDEEYLRNLGINMDSVHGTVQVRLYKRPAKKRDVGSVLAMDVSFRDGRVINLRLEERDPLLASSSKTPVWRTMHDPTQQQIYHQLDCDAMSNVGDFSFYQDYHHKAAVVWFHKDDSIQGYYYKYKVVQRRSNPSTTRSTYFLVYVNDFDMAQGDPQNFQYGPTYMPYNAPHIVYPQLLIVLTSSSVLYNTEQAIRDALVYFNGVDMIFSPLKDPIIRINIAGILLPQNDGAAPWNNHRLTNETLAEDESLREVSNYFQNLNNLFPDSHFDLMLAFTRYRIGPFIGRAWTNITCSNRYFHTAIIQESTCYTTATHEITHAFSGNHDQDSPCKAHLGIMSAINFGNLDGFDWSECSKKEISNYFRTPDKECYNNYPEPYATCVQSKPLPISPVPVGICAITPKTACNTIGYNAAYVPLYTGCKDIIWCYSPYSQNSPQWGKLQDSTGIVCEFSMTGGAAKVCYKGDCVPHHNMNPSCANFVF